MKVLYKIKSSESLNKKNIYILITIFISVLLILPRDITWARDRENYLNYAANSNIIMNMRYNQGLKSFIVNEPLFLFINIILSIILSPENVIRAIILVSTIGVLFSLGKLTKYNLWMIIIFIILPNIIKNHITHLRQGLALSFYLIGISSENKKVNILKYLSYLIHTSFIFIILFEVLEKMLKKIRLDYKLRLISAVYIFILIIILLPYLATLLGDRRALTYNFTFSKSGSGLGFLLWIIVGFAFLIFIKKNNMSILSLYGISFYLISYFSLDFSARIFENILPLIIVSTLNDSRQYVRIIFIGIYIFIGIMQWTMGAGLI